MEDKNVPEFIKRAIESQLTIESEKLVNEAKKELERKTPEIISSIVVDIMEMVEFQTMQDRIVFTIKKKT